MIIKNITPNIKYSDRIGHKEKNKVAEDKLSIKNFYKTPLKRESNDISFKGVFSLYKVKNFRLKDNLKLLKESLGDTPQNLYENFQRQDWQEIRDSIQTLSENNVQIKTKNWLKLLMEGVVYPVTELPLHMAKGVKELITGKNFEPIVRTPEEMANRTFLQKKMDILNNSDIVNSFSGMMESADKLKYDNKDIRSASLFTKAMKQFDQKAGNYNGVHERALTRIVTGFIPAFFLANDAYNLSRICDDDPQKAKVEHDTRFNQETKRVLSNAYLQLITLGALSKYINSSKWVFALVTATTVIATEAYSRLSNGKKIHFISKEEAIEINRKEKEKHFKNTEDKELKDTKSTHTIEKPTETEKTNYMPINFKGSNTFQAFGLAADMPAEIGINKIEQQEKATNSKTINNNEKPLISPEGIAKWFATMIIAGFAIKVAKKNIKINSQTLEKYFKVISKKYDDLYNKATQKEYIIKKEEFTKIVDKLNSYNPVIGEKFRKVTEKYQKASALKSNAIEIAKKLREEGFEDFAKAFEHLNNLKKDNSFADIEINDTAKKFFSNRNKRIIQYRLDNKSNTDTGFFKLIAKAGFPDDAKALKEILFKNGELDLSKYSDAKKYFNKHKDLKLFETTFDNRFRIDEDQEIINLFDLAINALKTKSPQKAKALKKITTDAVNNTEYTFGKRNRVGYKEAADFATQPVKFIWGTITLPYKHIANRIYNMVNHEYKLPEWEKEVDAVYNGVKKLTYKSKFKPNARARIDLKEEDFARYMDKCIDKAFNNATMSSISNADLSALAKNTSTAATAWFLLCDNHNMVMLKSNGEDKNGAVLKAKERAIQETSRTFWNVLFINLFNDTFRHTFNSSLLGAQAVNTASTLVGEYVNRKAIGMPVTKQSKDEILNNEYKNITDEGIKGNMFRFISRLTGKKVLTQREQTQKN